MVVIFQMKRVTKSSLNMRCMFAFAAVLFGVYVGFVVNLVRAVPVFYLRSGDIVGWCFVVGLGGAFTVCNGGC